MRLKTTSLMVAATMFSLGWHEASAKVSPSEAEKLKTTLTPIGAERAGNADGTIPAWTGGITQLPAGLTGADKMPDFFKSDRVLFTINASNVDQYASKLAPGTIYLLKHYPGYKINIYPTHRSAAAPQWFYDATFANATKAEIKDDNWVVNAHGGIPFPIPQTGKEIIWDLNLTWYGVQTKGLTSGYIVPPGGTPLLNATTYDQRWRPYADPNYTEGKLAAYYLLADENTVGPPNRVGNQILAYQAYDQTRAPQITWQYLVGQRRLRKAPQVTYDGAYPDCGGIATTDELALFDGAPDRYNISIVGKQEMYVPYNNNAIGFATSDQLLQPHFVNPDFMRWELHRVWIVDLKLAPGKSHLLPHRRVYLDEDTWQGTTSEDYDAQGTLWKIGQAPNYTNPAFPGNFAGTNILYDTKGAGYCVLNGVTADHPTERLIMPANPPYPPSFFSPNTVAAESAR